jgi:hypothetical protein
MNAGVRSGPSEPSMGRWRKARRSMASGSNCVEVKIDDDAVHVRDSKNPTGPSLKFTVGQWASLLMMIRNG